MPRTRSRISTTEAKEDCDRLLRLEQRGVAIGNTWNSSTKPDRFILEQIDHEFARVYDLPYGGLAVVVPARLIVLTSGSMIVAQRMTTAGDEYELELSDPREHEHRSFRYPMRDFSNYPTVLNVFLAERSVPLSRGRIKGVIFATGWSCDPASRCQGPFLTMELALRDEQSNESYCKFRAEVDRSMRQRYERLQQERRLATPMGKPEGLYGTKIRAGDQISIPPKPNVGSESDAISDFQPSRSGRSIPAPEERYRSKIQ